METTASGRDAALEAAEVETPSGPAFTLELNQDQKDVRDWVHGFATAGGTPTPFKLNYWLLGGTSAGNMTVSAPGSATLGATGNIGLTFGGLSAGTKYLGSIVYGPSPADTIAPTIVRVDTP